MGETMVDLENIRAGYRAVKGENRPIFDGFSREDPKGREGSSDRAQSGAGKSTMMKLMIGLMKPEEGTVFLQGKNTRKMSPEEMSRLISMVYQNPGGDVYQGFHPGGYCLCHESAADTGLGEENGRASGII